MSFIPKLSVSQLGAISAVGGVITVVFAGFVRNRIAYNIERQPFCKEPMKLLRNHEGANYILGKGFQVKVLLYLNISILRFVKCMNFALGNRTQELIRQRG